MPQETYIALLRGVNVGLKGRVSMSDLAHCFSAIGFRDVQTYINSGNVLFSYDYHPLNVIQDRCEKALLDCFGFSIPCVILTGDDLNAIRHEAPVWWGKDQDSKHNAIFVIAPKTSSVILEELGELKPDYERVHCIRNIILWTAPLKTFSRTRWSTVVGTPNYAWITIRNANTVFKLIELYSKREIT